MIFDEFLKRLNGVHASGNGFMALCPGHPDKKASCSVMQGKDGRILLHCFAGCKPESILAAMGLKWEDLYSDKPRRNGTPPRKAVSGQYRRAVVEPCPTAAAAAPTCKAVGLADLAPDATGNQELIRNRYVCRGASVLFVGPTGIGKSSLALQLALRWAAGRECFGFAPTRPLKSLIIQAENDAGDLCEMRDGVLAGMDFSEVERLQALAGIRVATNDSASGPGFLKVIVQPLVSEHRPDILWLDPLLSYLGGDVSKQEVVSGFLRNGLNPILHEFGCAAIVIHHTNKPASGTEKREWQAGDFAYLGSGSADLANWARAVIAIRSLGSNDVFELRASKRGGRLGWTESDNQTRRYTLPIAHDPRNGVICWRQADASEVPDNPGSPKSSAKTKADLLAHVPAEGAISQTVLLQKANAADIGQKKGRAFLDELLADGTVHLWLFHRKGTNAEKRISRHPQSEPELPMV